MIFLLFCEVSDLEIVGGTSGQLPSAKSRLTERSNVFKGEGFNAPRFGRLKLAPPQLLRYSSSIY
jgi:hypothetical protein